MARTGGLIFLIFSCLETSNHGEIIKTLETSSKNKHNLTNSKKKRRMVQNIYQEPVRGKSLKIYKNESNHETNHGGTYLLIISSNN